MVRTHGGRLPIEIVPVYGVDTARFSPASEASSVRAGLGLPANGTILFFSSRIAPEKDSETLLSAAHQLRSLGEELWILHRSGGYRSFLADAARFGVADRVIATDAVHPHGQLPLDYQACDICVQASRAEGLGFSALEALASELPVVASAVGGLRETVIEGSTGWTYPVGDVDALAAQIRRVIREPEEAARRAAAGRDLVREGYDRGRVFSRLAEYLEASLPS